MDDRAALFNKVGRIRISMEKIIRYENKYGNLEEIYETLCVSNEIYMDGFNFEYFCADILSMDGYVDIEVTKASQDNGVDIKAKKNGKTYIVQCKCLSKTCSNKSVQEIIAGKSLYGADGMIVMCNKTFSDSAKILANRNGVDLINAGQIKHIMDMYFCLDDMAAE